MFHFSSLMMEETGCLKNMVQRLPKEPDLAAFMQRGQRFLFAVKVLGAMRERRAVAGFAIVVNSAFAAEVFLKVLAIVEKKQPPLKTHDLEKLFRDVSDETQELIKAEWEKKCLPDLLRLQGEPSLPKEAVLPKSFDEALHTSALAFVEWRYSVSTEDNLSYNLIALPDMLLARIANLRPDLIRSERTKIVRRET